MTGLCKDCRQWMNDGNGRIGTCALTASVDGNGYWPSNAVAVSEDRKGKAALWTWSDFGCNQFQAIRTEAKPA